MISHSKNRVQAIKSKFENLNQDTQRHSQLSKHNEKTKNVDKENTFSFNHNDNSDTESSDDWPPKPNMSYLYKNDVKRSVSDTKKVLVRQSSDPGKKLHRSHAFRCDRSQKIVSPKRHGSCNGRSESADFTLKMERKLSKDRLKKLGNLLEEQMRKENFVYKGENVITDSIPDCKVPQHILDQYAKVVKPKKMEPEIEKKDGMTDSGVSSETENLEEEKTGRIKKLMTHFQKTDESNLESMTNLCTSSDTIRLERKNPHLQLTDTLKKALKQPLPAGPPPKKPPRTFIDPIPESPEKSKKDTKKMLEKLEEVLHKREAALKQNEYDIPEDSQEPVNGPVEKQPNTVSTLTRPKEIHYLCTEILDITQRTLLPNQTVNCFPLLNCAATYNSTLSLPYTKLTETRPCSCIENNDSNTENKCISCQSNEKLDGFKCHLNCKCKVKPNSAFFVDEHIYDEPFRGEETKSLYGTLNPSKSLDDLTIGKIEEDEKVYDIPCDESRPATPETPISEFEKLRQNFENASRDQKPDLTNAKPENDTKKIETRNFGISDTKKISENIKDRINSIEDIKNTDTDKDKLVDTRKFATVKPPMRPKPVFVKNMSRSIENIGDPNLKSGIGTEVKYRKNRSDTGLKLSLPKKDNTQLDVDRENLNRLMSEIYETVTRACNMEDNKPASFPNEQSEPSEESVKLTRSLTEKRKNYVRRVSSRVAYLDQKNIKTTRFRHQTSVCSYKSEPDNPYSTFRSWKSFRTSQNNLTKDKMEDTTDSFNSDNSGDKLSIDEKTGCVDIGLPFERERGLFDVCLLVGLNYMTGQAYVKSVFPNQVQVPPHIENLIFPETLSAGKGQWSAEAKGAQCYSLVLTDERGERSYGYCRRVLPEGATTCLPLCYCLIGKYRAPGFYYKVLQEIESHHGSSEVEIHSILQQLFETDFPTPGEEITIEYTNTQTDNKYYRNSVNLGDILKCKTMPDMRRSKDKDESDKSEVKSEVKSDSNKSESEKEHRFESVSGKVPEFYDLENNNGPKKVFLSLEGPRTKTLKRPIEPRIDEDNLSVLLDCLGAGLTIKVFGSLLLERKVLIVGDQLSLVSSCMEALQNALYPFVWQQPLISTVPAEIQREVLDAPLPILAGMTGEGGPVDEGMLIDLTQPSKVISYQGDEASILPACSYKTLKTALQMETRNKQDSTRNVMISEAFLRFFVDILGDFWRFFTVGELKEGALGKGDVVFDKDLFIKNSTSKQNQSFLEWFTETAMFNHFIQNMAVCYRQSLLTGQNSNSPLKLTPSLPNSSTPTKNMAPISANMASPIPNVNVELNLVDTPLPNFYELFHERVNSRNKTNKCTDGKNNYKTAMNKKIRILKSKLRELVT